MAARSARSWNFLKVFWPFQWEKIIFCQNAYFCLKMIYRPCYFYFSSALCEWGGWVLKSAENSALFSFFFETFPNLQILNWYLPECCPPSMKNCLWQGVQRRPGGRGSARQWRRRNASVLRLPTDSVAASQARVQCSQASMYPGTLHF